MTKGEKVDFNGIRKINIENKKNKEHHKKRFKKHHKGKSGLSQFLKKLTLVFLIFIPIIWFIGYKFHSANIKVSSPNRDNLTFNHEVFKANVNPENETVLGFKWYEFDMSFKKEVEAEFAEAVKEKAVGIIKIINEFNKPQKLRKETRFETQDRKLYKIYKSVTVPAKSSIVREAFADLPGAEYNISKGVKLTIPGFKEVNDMESYEKMTGEVAEDFKGGFIGKKSIVKKETLEAKKKELEEEIKETIAVKVRSNLPKDYVLNTDGIFTKIEYTTEDKDGKTYLVANVHTKAIIYNELDLISVTTGLSKDKIRNYTIDQKAYLKFKILNKDEISFDSLKEFNFELDGQMTYVEKFNKDKFIERIKGRNIDVVENILKSEYSNFDVDISIFPFWSKTIPNDEKNITLEE